MIHSLAGWVKFKRYVLHSKQNQEVQVYCASSEWNLSFKSLILAQVSRILIYVYIKLQYKSNKTDMPSAQVLLKIISQDFYQLALQLMFI